MDDASTSGKENQIPSDQPNEGPEKNAPSATRGPSIIVGAVAAVVVALSLFYLLRPEPLLVQGEADATRLDIAARVDVKPATSARFSSFSATRS
jgi:HlyD family secretion protein